MNEQLIFHKMVNRDALDKDIIDNNFQMELNGIAGRNADITPEDFQTLYDNLPDLHHIEFKSAAIYMYSFIFANESANNITSGAIRAFMEKQKFNCEVDLFVKYVRWWLRNADKTIIAPTRTERELFILLQNIDRQKRIANLKHIERFEQRIRSGLDTQFQVFEKVVRGRPTYTIIEKIAYQKPRLPTDLYFHEMGKKYMLCSKQLLKHVYQIRQGCSAHAEEISFKGRDNYRYYYGALYDGLNEVDALIDTYTQVQRTYPVEEKNANVLSLAPSFYNQSSDALRNTLAYTFRVLSLGFTAEYEIIKSNSFAQSLTKSFAISMKALLKSTVWRVHLSIWAL